MKSKANKAPFAPPTSASFCALSFGIALTMAGSVQAGIPIPNKPVELGAAVPPNVMMIFDTSGSMQYRSLPNYDISINGGGLSTSDDNDSVPIGGPDGTRELNNSTNVFDFQTDTVADVSFRTHTYNTLSYNPAVTYAPWSNSDGSLMANTPYSAVYDSGTLASGSTVNLFSYNPVFLSPKPGATDLNNVTQYYRYRFQSDGTLIRSDRDQVSSTTTVLINRAGLSAVRNNWVNGNTGATAPNTIAAGLPAMIVVPPGTLSLVVRTEGNDPDADLYVRYNALPVTGLGNTATSCFQTNASSNETCTFTNPVAGNWFIGVRADDFNDSGTSSDGNNNTFSNVRLIAEIVTGDPETGIAGADCSTAISGWGWRHCTPATPTGRTDAEERANYANWWSYHRTRNKAAKAGVTRAFSELGGEYRVGLSGLTSITQRIPVNSDGGLFRDRSMPSVTNNRSDWFASVKTLPANDSTPLRTALQRVGNYYSESATADNPYKGTGAVELACRQNFALLTTDGYWNGGLSFSGLSGDEDNGAVINGPVGSGQTYQYLPTRPFMSSDQNTLADVAMHFWKTDLRTLDNIVPTTTADPGFWQHMSTFGISLGLRGELLPTDYAGLVSGSESWPTPSDGGGAENIDDLWHAAVNGRGSFVAATSPQLFASALRSALAAVVERTASSSNVSANTSTLTTETLLFQARYVSNRWIGDLVAYPVNSTGTDAVPEWSASEEVPDEASRTILTWNGTTGAEFPTAAQATLLNTPKAGVSNYLRGDRTLELGQNGGGDFRNRVHVLGDIVNSSPVYSQETDTVYVGANDGMLHAFNGSSGAELFAYVPGNIDFTALKNLANDNYSHTYFVDGPVSVSKKDLNNSNKNYLVAALGRGGKGVFALDVSDPGNFDTTDALWDFKPAVHEKMGNVLGRPLISKLNTGTIATVVPNGPNSTGDTAVLYVLNIETGDVIAEIDTGVGSTAFPNGLSTPRGWDEDGDKDTDIVYAGDLLGNLWRFNLSSSNPADWSLAANRMILFSPKDSGGKVQPMTGSPSIAIDPDTYKTWVFFGTGRLLNVDDINNADGTPNLSVQSWYGLIDENTPIANRAALQQRLLVDAGVIDGKPVRSFEQTTSLPVGKKGWYVDWLQPVPATTTRIAQGERVISDTILVGRNVFVSTVIPSTATCGGSGTGYLNVIDAFTGATVREPVIDADGDGEFTDDYLDNTGQDIWLGSIGLGVDMPTMPVIIGDGERALGCVGGSGGDNACIGLNNPAQKGRISWREVIRD